MLFVPIKFKTTVQLYPVELDAKYQERILEKLREEYEGICTKYGYIKPESLEIIKRSCGNLQKAYFNGVIRFEVLCRAEVCNPVQNSIVEATVKNKNQLGILAESYIEFDKQLTPILDIIVPIKSAGIISQVNLDQIQIGEVIHIEVMGKKYQMRDRKISIIGRVVIPEEKHIEHVVTEEEEVEPGLEEEEYIELEEDDKDGGKKEGGAEDEEEEDEDEGDYLEGGEDDFEEDFDEDGAGDDYAGEGGDYE